MPNEYGIPDALARQKVLAVCGPEPLDFWDIAVASQLPRDVVIQAVQELEESHEVRREAGECMPVFRRDDAFWAR